MIGNQKGIEAITKVNLKQNSTSSEKSIQLDTYVYQIAKGGLLYTIFLYNTQFNSNQENIRTVKKILSTFKFN